MKDVIAQIKKPTLLYGLGVASPLIDYEKVLIARNDAIVKTDAIRFLEDNALIGGLALEYAMVSRCSFSKQEITQDATVPLRAGVWLTIRADASITIIPERAERIDERDVRIVILDVSEGVRANVRIVQDSGEQDIFLFKAVVRKGGVLNYNELVIKDSDSFRHSRIVLEGDDAQVYPHHAVFSYGDARIDIKSDVDHYGERSISDMKMKTIVSDRSEAIIQGDVTIKPSAFGSNGYQKEDIIMLGSHSIARPIPNLEIGNHDVKCSHGATVSAIDEESLFYLASRGIEKRAAISLIVSSFLNPILTLFTVEERETYRARLHAIVESSKVLE